MRVLHLTDPHLFAEADGELRGTVTLASLENALAHYRAGDWRADLVAVTGDIIQDDSRHAYLRFREKLATLGLPVHVVPGNHDVRALMREMLSAPPFHYCDAAEIGRWLIVGIDSCLEGEAGGAIGDDELARLDALIDGSAAPNVLVCLHHPPVELGSRWLDSVGLADGEAFIRRLERSGRVRLAIFGHVHQAYDRRHGSVRIIATPSTCSQFLPLSDDFAVDNRPPAYRRLELRADGSFDNQLIWVDNA